MRRFQPLIVGIGLTAMLALPTIAIGDTGSAGSTDVYTPASPALPYADLPDSDQIEGPQLAKGKLSGKQPGTGRVAYALAWPKPSVLKKIRPGDVVPLTPVAQAQISSDGSFTLRVSHANSLKAFASGPNSTVNMDIIAASDMHISTQTFSRQLDDASELQGSAPQLDIEESSESVPQPAPDAGTKPGTVASASPVSAAADYEAQSLRCFLVPCRTVYQSSTYHWARIGETFVGYSLQGQFGYKIGGSSDFGVGISAPGGSWSLGGTVGSSSSVGATWGRSGSLNNTVYYKQLEYGKYAYQYFDAFGWHTYQYGVRPIGDTGGFKTGTASETPNSNHCAPIQSNVSFTWTRNANNFYTFSGGVNMSSYIGIHLSARTGADRSAYVNYYFDPYEYGTVCGDTDAPSKAKRILSRGGSVPHN